MSKEIPPYTESDFPGFYLIEGFSRYAVHADGRVLDLKRVIVIPVYRDKKGYNYVSVVNDEGKRILYQRYRILMIALSDRPDNYRDLLVNHLDNIHGNDALDNLEWTTFIGNYKHAADIGAFPDKKGISIKAIPIVVLEVATQKETTFESLTSCANFLGISVKRLNKILQLDQAFFRGDYLIKSAADTRPWRKVEVGEKIYNETGNIILVRDVISGVVEEWLSYQQYAEANNLSKDAVRWRLRSTKHRVFPEMKQYKFKDDPTPWKIPTEEDLYKLDSYGTKEGILVKDLIQNTVTRYISQAEMARDLGISIPTTTLWLSKKDRIHGDRYLVQRDTLSPVWRQIDNLQEAIIRESKVKRSVEVTNANGETVSFPSASMAAKAFDLLPTTVNNRLKSNGQRVFSDGTRWKYL